MILLRFFQNIFILSLRAWDSIFSSHPSFYSKCYRTIATALKFVVHLNLPRNNFHRVWKQAAISPIKKWGNNSFSDNSWSVIILRNSSESFEFITSDQVSRLLKSKINPTQHDCTRSRFPVTNLVTFFDTVTAFVQSQDQTGSIYFHSSNAFDIIHMTCFSINLITMVYLPAT